MDSLERTLYCAKRGAINYFTKRPFCVSFEVTYRCNARCGHCHLGGPVPNEKQAGPEEFGRICRELKPVVAQVSGGEPLLRKDLEDIIEALRTPRKDPVVVLTTNASLLTRERYDSLRAAGVDEFSISFDYPDERHDDFRTIPGLFKKIEGFLEDIKDVENKGVTLSCVVHRQNFRELLKIAEFARKWNVRQNFSSYTWLRTNRKDDFMFAKDEIPELKEKIAELIEHKRKYDTIFTSEYVFSKMIQWFENQKAEGCMAGERFAIVGPDGTLSPCGLILKNYSTRKEMLENFTKNNKCTSCFTSIRVNSEKRPLRLIRDNISKAFK